MKTCTKCGEHKEETEFYKKMITWDGLETCCKNCRILIYEKPKRQTRRAIGKTYTIQSVRQRLSGIRKNSRKGNYTSPKERAATVYRCVPFKEKCHCCSNPLLWKDAKLDHCHKTGNVRGWVCNPCNLALGHEEDNPGRLEKCIRFLKETPQQRRERHRQEELASINENTPTVSDEGREEVSEDLHQERLP